MTDHFDLIGAENQRLLKEVRQLRARVAALESSRWWRLHPRFALRRLVRGRRNHDAGVAEARGQNAPAPEVGRLTERFQVEVIARGSFTNDWFTGHISAWEPLMEMLEGRPANVLELGSFEGMSASFVLWRLPRARVTCVDTFGGSAEHSGLDVDRLEERFDHNVALVDGERVRKIVASSVDGLRELGRSGERFDLIYVDASHFALDVLVDACLAWPLLLPGGILIFDDYEWLSPLGEDPLLLPRPGVDAFLALVAAQCEVLARSGQAIIRKAGSSSAAEPLADPIRESTGPR